MSEMKPTELPQRRRAEADFSIAPFQRVIDERFNQPAQNTFTADELKLLGSQANKAMALQADDEDAYSKEVFVLLDDNAYIYDMQTSDEAEIPRRVALDEEVIYGYINGIKVETLPDSNRMALMAAFERYHDDITELSHSYYIPLAIEEKAFGVRLADAPTAVGESAVEVAGWGDFKAHINSAEQGTIHSLLSILEEDIFDEAIVDTEMLEESIDSLRAEGYIDDLDTMVTACNYYLQKCLHEGDPWLIRPDTIMEELEAGYYYGGASKRRGVAKWVTEVLTVVGIDIRLKEDNGVRCVIYARSDEDILYRRQTDYEGTHTLYREEEDLEDLDREA